MRLEGSGKVLNCVGTPGTPVTVPLSPFPNEAKVRSKVLSVGMSLNVKTKGAAVVTVPTPVFGPYGAPVRTVPSGPVIEHGSPAKPPFS